MSVIITANFATKGEADVAARSLKRIGIKSDRMCSFAVDPPGQYATFPIGGDHHASPGAEHAGSGALAGATIGGAVGGGAGLGAAAALGPAAVVGAAGAGAYVGSLLGAHNKLGSADPAGDPRADAAATPAGVLLAIQASVPTEREEITDVLYRSGAREVAATRGVWRNGTWVDYDPAHI
jgi:hypothetical protein